jgi:hypothetical protein
MSAISVRNITRVFRDATPAQFEDGLVWYETAYTIADALSVAHDVPVSRVAGIISAFSPRNSWGANINGASRFVASQGMTGGHTQDNVNKALKILDGANPEKTLNGLKTVAFYECIMSRGLTLSVCIDRHAFDIATNTRNTEESRKITAPNFRACVTAYRKASVILSRELGYPVSPAQVQAVTWVAWRARYWNEGAFDVKS